MKHLVTSLVPALILVLFFCCDARPTPDRDLKQRLTREIESTIAQYCSDIKTRGLTAEFKYLDDSPEFLWTPPGATSPITYDSVVKILTLNAPSLKCVDNSYQSLDIEVLDENHATYSAKVRSILTSNRGQVTRMYLEERGVLIRRNDGWKLQSGVTRMVPR